MLMFNVLILLLLVDKPSFMPDKKSRVQNHKLPDSLQEIASDHVLVIAMFTVSQDSCLHY